MVRHTQKVFPLNPRLSRMSTLRRAFSVLYLLLSEDTMGSIRLSASAQVQRQQQVQNTISRRNGLLNP